MTVGYRDVRWLVIALVLTAMSSVSPAQTANRAPTISGTPPTTVALGITYDFTPVAGDPDGDPISFSVWNKPSWASFAPSTGRLVGTPQASDVGTYNAVFITVTDGRINTVLGPFNITVRAAGQNRAPTISGTPLTSVTQGSQYAFQPTAGDPDGDPISFSVWNKPPWATFNAATGRLSGTPSAGDVGTNSAVFITVTDGLLNTVLGPFNITVLAGTTQNRPPTISGTPPTSVVAGTQYAFQPTAGDPDGNPISFSVWNKPPWATFNAATGRLSGTPGAGDVGTDPAVFITVTDGWLNTVLGPFNITVLASGTQNRPPTISGTPATSVVAGTQYAFQPTAGDPDGNPISFSVWNKPPWATFDAATGRLSGTPGAGDVGTNLAVFITVTDGWLNTVLGPFNITVLASASGSATLSWQPPTQNTDGSPLTNLAGYKIYWGTSAGVYPNSVTLSNPGLTSYVVSNLASGTYFFAMSALSATGAESAKSNPASKKIP